MRKMLKSRELLMFSAAKQLTRTLYLCSYVLHVRGSLRRQPLCFLGHADVSPWPAAQRPFVYLMKTYVAYVFRAKRLTQTLYLLFLCPYVLLFSALAANLKHLHLVIAFGA